MPRCKFEDVPGGNTVVFDVLDETNGYKQCTFGHNFDDHQAYFDAIPGMKCKDDDFLINSYPKTGTHWLWEMLSMVVTAQSGTVDRGIKEMGMIEARPTEVIENYPSPRVLSTHLKVKYLPKQIVEKRLKMILIVRNPKDVVVSFYNHMKGIGTYQYDGKFENFLQMFMRGDVDYGCYADYLKEWQDFMKENPDYPIHVVYYEHLQEDCLGQMLKICNFLEKDIDLATLEGIVDRCTFDNLQEVKPNEEGLKLLQKMATRLKDNFKFYRKGKVGDWKNWFTVSQNELFEQWWRKETQAIDMFSFRYI